MEKRELHLGNGNCRLPYSKMKNFMVEGYFNDLSNDPNNFKEGCGYIIDGIVYIFYDMPRNTHIPWFSYNKLKKKYVMKKRSSISPKDLEDFSIDKVRDISFEHVEESISENEVLYNEEELRYLNSSQAKYIPTIEETDDFLKMIVKKILICLNININKFAPEFDAKHTLTNMKTALTKSTKTSTMIFSKWMELFKADFAIVVRLKRASKRMPGYILYKSWENSVEYVDKVHKEDIE